VITADSSHAARAYWMQQAEEAFDFMTKMRTYPIAECGERMASLVEAAEGLKVRFSTGLLGGKFPHVFFIREGLVKSFRDVCRKMNDRGWILYVEDGYRSPEMQRGLSDSTVFFDRVLKQVMWELNGAVPDPAFMFRRLSVMIATRSRVGTHVAGTAIDIAVIDEATGKEVDRGAVFPEISERTPMASPFVSPEARRNRDEIERIFKSCGWIAYPWEFWHFNAGDCFAEYLTHSGKPGRYGPIRFENGRIQPIGQQEADTPLQPLEFYERQIQAALQRMHSTPVSTHD
jgi:D-alanyl-D-alanine dipeptidase